MIAILNYGLGNIQAFVNIYTRLNIPVTVATREDELVRAEKIILPGVGSFDWAMSRLNDSGLRSCLDNLVVGLRRPVLGVCVGMQMMANSSEEGKLEGLGWFEAEVRRFAEVDFKQRACLPHMGWNDVTAKQEGCLFRHMEEVSRFYFLHSYYFSPAQEENVMAVTEYNGFSFASAVRSGNMCGVQFHPEKSHEWGIQLLRNFAEF